MSDKEPGFLYSFFRFVVARRWWVVAFYALLLGPAVYYALRVEQDNSIDRLIVKSDPAYVTAQEFQKVFGAGEFVLLLLEAQDPFAPAVVARVSEIEKGLAALPRLNVNSMLSIYRGAEPRFQPDAAGAEALRRFATGTDIFRKQGLFGDNFLALPVVISVGSARERADILRAVDQVLAPYEKDLAPLSAIRKVGQPYVNAYLDKDTRSQGMRYFPLFGLFVLVLNISLYRSLRALVAFLLSLGVSVALTVGYVGVTGGLFTIVSSLVPMTVLITCTATLVYIHSRYVERPADRSVEDHQIFALVNKFLACTASIFATAVGFAALAVSKIRPVREMGIWVAIGLLFTWVVVFTLFPALQRILKTPTSQERKVAGQWFLHFCAWLPRWSYTYRKVLVPGSLVLCGVGIVALFGIPGVLPGMELQTKTLEYISHDSALYKDTKQLEKVIAGLSMTEVWLQGQMGSVATPEAVRGLRELEAEIAKEAGVGSVVGLPTVLRTIRYVSGKGDRLPEEDEALERLLDGLEAQMASQPLLARFVDGAAMGQTHMTVVTRTMDDKGFDALSKGIEAKYRQVAARHPALSQFKLRITGIGLLEAKISAHLVPTLVESFWLTVVIIFGTFLVVFRSGAARLMAMIPSLFAILVMFIFMRLFGMNLNVATILIASTVLGTSENDQIHFFYHFLEGKKDGGSTEQALQHTLFIAGRAIFFATLINAGGFLAFALADLPPIRQFGILSAVAFVLSMLADFTALPAALWMVFRDRPDALKKILGKEEG
jgi:hypothetical protein